MGWVIVIGLYIVLLFFFVTYVGLPAVAISGVVFAVIFIGNYLRVLAQTMVVSPSPNPSPLRYPASISPPAGEEPAFRQYFFGQAIHDLRHVLTQAYQRCREITMTASDWIKTKCFDEGVAAVTWPVGAVAYAGLAIGVIGGAIAVAGLALVHIVVVLVLQVLGQMTAYLLRGIDSALFRLKGISITCPTCYQAVGYPAYDCPNTSCTARHNNIRPGRYGVIHRTCVCGSTMPTLILLGSHQLDAFCPHCRGPLADKSGTTAEVILPLFGASAAGKTRLMLAIVMALDEMARGRGATLDFGDADTGRRYESLKPVLVQGQTTRATTTTLPRAYSLYLTPKKGAVRLVHLFDAAGELFNTSERLEELKYLRVARSFLFVVDPLSIQSFWDLLPEHEQTRLAPFRTPARSSEFIFQQTCQNIQDMGVETSRARLAVAITKSDLTHDVSARTDVGMSTEAIEDWLLQRLGLGNLVRSMNLNFGQVHFFFTSAVTDPTGRVSASVTNLMTWLFDGERLHFEPTSKRTATESTS